MMIKALLVSAIFGAALALPASDPSFTGFESLNITSAERLSTRSLEKRQEGGVFITTDWHWEGTTGYAKQNWDVCIRLDYPWWHSISSIGPDSGNAIIYSEDYNCNNPGGTIFSPGYDDLNQIGWNDRIGSFVVRQVAVWDADLAAMDVLEVELAAVQLA
ncbi:hypothetical protein DL95DRAFT_465263 [Leptodontidium sp. 2 PMI_412]|nr:hypothetical protein DL95DRAFT_465263 [Leptodontidium sp. 2 PMI_412]